MTLSGCPERALRMPEIRQSENAARSALLAICGVCDAGDEAADVRPVLIAQAAIEVGIIGVGVAVRNLREAAGLQGGIAEAARHRVVAAEAHARGRATLERQLQPPVVLRADGWWMSRLPISRAAAGFSPDSENTRRWFRFALLLHVGVEHALQRAGAEPQEDAWIDRHLFPQPVGVTADVARRHLPDRSELPLDGDVPLLDARRVDVRIGRAEGAEREELRVAVRHNRVRIAADVRVGPIEPAGRILDERAVAERRRVRVDQLILGVREVVGRARRRRAPPCGRSRSRPSRGPRAARSSATACRGRAGPAGTRDRRDRSDRRARSTNIWLSDVVAEVLAAEVVDGAARDVLAEVRLPPQARS